MGQIGRFIDKACDAHPELMRKVLDRPFGSLHSWVQFDEEGEACGCLIGTVALAAGVDAQQAQDDDDLTCDFVDKIMSVQPWQVYGLAFEVGMQVSRLARRLGTSVWDEYGIWWCSTPESDARAAEMIKRRIARRLGVTSGSLRAVPAMAEG
jgi:hypothetical protein